MGTANELRIEGEAGLRGMLLAEEAPGAGASRVRIRLDSGDVIEVPVTMLERKAAGGFFLPLTLEEAAAYRPDALTAATTAPDSGPADAATIPVVEEQLKVGKIWEETGKVVVHKTVHERRELVDQTLLSETVRVERVPVGRIVERAEAPRQEGDALIVPLYEEVLVVEKRLLLREELHIIQQREERREPREYTLRSEEVEIERRESDAA